MRPVFRHKNKRVDEKGASAVEFAIILPILVILIFGIVEFAIAFNNYITITHAAREGARKAAVDLFDPGLIDYIKNKAIPLSLEDEDIVVDWEGSPADPDIGDSVWVEITYNMHLSIPLVGSWDIPLRNKAIMRLENYAY
jgi:Flp pilus assembly pilin Flp